MPDLIHIQSGSAGKHRPEASWMILAHRLASGPDLFGKNPPQSTRTKLDPGWFCTVLSRTSVEERNQVWKWETGSRLVASCQKPEPMIPAHWLPSRPDVFCQALTRLSRLDLSWFSAIWSMPSVEKWNLNGCGKSDLAYTIWADSGCTLAVMAIIGCNQNTSGSDPACLLGRLGWAEVFTRFYSKCVCVSQGWGWHVCLCGHACMCVYEFVYSLVLLKTKEKNANFALRWDKAMEPTHILRAGFSLFRVTDYMHHISVANTDIATWKINRKGSSSSVLPQTSMTFAKTSRRVQNNLAQPERVPGSS